MKNADVNAASMNYLELCNQAYAVLVDAFSTRTLRTIDNAKAMYEILSRPPAQAQHNTIDAVMRDSLDRAQQIVTLTVTELKTSARRATEVTTSLAETGMKLQQAWLQYACSTLQSSVPAPSIAVPATDGTRDAAPIVAEKPQEAVAAASAN